MTDQQIRDRCNWLADMIIRKHKNYGNSVERPPVLQRGMNPGAAIFVRMSDKIERIAALSSGQVDLVGESIEDSVNDLAGYCILWGVIYKERTTEAQETGPREEAPATDYDGLKCPI